MYWGKKKKKKTSKATHRSKQARGQASLVVLYPQFGPRNELNRYRASYCGILMGSNLEKSQWVGSLRLIVLSACVKLHLHAQSDATFQCPWNHLREP